MDQVKFVEDSFKKMKWYDLPKEAKFYLVYLFLKSLTHMLCISFSSFFFFLSFRSYVMQCLGP